MRDRSHSMHHRLLLSIGILLGLLLVALPSTAIAQSGDEGWSTPVKLYEGQGSTREPALAADQTGALHAFWAYEEEGFPMAIFYARWEDDAWTPPVDVISMPGVMQGPSAVVDQFGRIHLIWQGPGNTLFYSSADVADATTATAWTSPVSLAQSNPHAHIVIDDARTLHIVYPALVEGGVYTMSSVDGGQTWTAPALVATPVRANATTDFARMAVAPNGDLHVIWTELTLPSGWPPLGAFYARSTDGGLTWSEPIEMASDGYLEANIVAVDDNAIHVVWNAMASIAGRFHRWSSDAGDTWSQPSEIASRQLGGGSTNPPALAADRMGNVHVVVNTQPGGVAGTDATMYILSREETWSTPLDISQAAPGYVGLTNEASALAIVDGNLLHVLFVDNDGARMWHTSKSSDAPMVPPVAFLGDPQRSPTTSPGKTETPTPSPTATTALTSGPSIASLDTSQISSSRSASTSPATNVMIGVLPALVVVGGVVLFSLSRRRTR